GHVLIKITSVNGRVAPGGVVEDSISVPIADSLFKASLDGVRVYQKTIPLRPGLYKMDIVVKDMNSGNVGVVNTRLQVPRFPEEKLQLSSLIVADLVENLPNSQVGTGMFTLG